MSATALRAAGSGDLAEVERLLDGAGLPLAGVRESLGDFVVAEAEGGIVGVIGLERCGDSALLRSAAVDPAWRSRGLGRSLVERIVADANRRNLRALYLLTTTAERYFANLGFTHTTRDAVPDSVRATAEFQGACPASATVMTLALGMPPR